MATKKPQAYNGNASLKAAGVQTEFTGDQINEYMKCAEDPIYFIKTYVKIIHVDKGIIPFTLHDYQERLVTAYHTNRKVVALAPRQFGKTITTAAYFLWVVLFNADKNIGILANKAAMAREILSRIQLSYELLPLWLQQGVMEWNKGSIKLENNSKIFTAATSPNAIRGNSCSHVYVDEIAFIPTNIAEEFMTSVFPVLSSGKETKIFITSTPRGMNMFHKLWVEAENGKNGFVPIRIVWTENPDRDLAWLDEQRRVLGEVKFNQEILVEFHGSSSTLVDGRKLSTIPFHDPIFEKDKLKIYKKPIPGNSYICTVDTSRGQHLDYSAFVIFDTTTVPYQVVATFKDNTISSMTYPYMIINTCKQFNDAYLLIEVNDIGGEVANIIFYEFEYPNVYFTNKENLTEGQGYPGVRTTKKVKAVGCSVLKELVEQDQLIINSIDIIQELAVFSAKGASYAAEDTKINDDLTACLFLFSWLTKQMIFKDITNTNIRALLAKKNEEYILDQMTPFGFIDNGLDSIEIDMLSSKPRDISGTAMSIDDWIMS